MVDRRITDGRRIAELLASEVTGRTTGPLGNLAVVDADRDIDPTADGAFAYGIDAEDERLADVSVHPERASLELRGSLEAATAAATERDLRVRPKDVDPPRTLVFVESGGAVKAAVDVLAAAAEAVGEGWRRQGLERVQHGR